MDYEGQVRQVYTIPTSDIEVGLFIYFYNDGTYDIVNDVDFNVNEYDSIYMLQGYCANYCNRVLNRGSDLVFFGYTIFNRDILFCNTNRIDYIIYGSDLGGNTLVGEKFVAGDDLDDLTEINNYYQSPGYRSFQDFQDENSYLGNFHLSNYSGYAVFDYTNLRYGELESSVQAIRGENMAFYNYVTEFYYGSNANNLYFAYGDPYASQYKVGFDNAFANGWVEGYAEGKEDGYIAGVNSQGGQVQVEPATAFTYIKAGFDVAGSIMSLEVLPNITLGLCFSIPLVFVLIITIFRLVRK